MTILAVDVGRTHCRAGVFTTDPDGALRPGPSISRSSAATVVDPDGPARVAGTVTAALGELGLLADLPGPATVAVAAAGSLSRREPVARMADQLAGALAAPAQRGDGPGCGIDEIIVTSDVVAAHAGAFDGAPGVVLAVGTGAVAFALDAAGRHHVVDGGGYLVGDAGSGFAVGRAGLAAALRYEDGRPGGSAALAAAATRLAPPGGTLREVVVALHGGTDPTRRVARVAAFAPEVATAARAGDPVAGSIWRDAATQLAETAVAACRALPEGAREVVLVGALFQVEDLLVAPLRALIAEGLSHTTVRVGSADALVGAANLARRPASGYESLLLSRPVGGR